MPRANVSMKIEGLEPALAKLAELGDDKATDRRIGSAMRAAAKPVQAFAVKKAQQYRRTGALARAIIINTRKIRGSGNRNVRVGISSTQEEIGFSGSLTANKSGRLTFSEKTIRPNNYAHLVEFGHDVKNKKGGPVLGRVNRRPFLRPAQAREGGEKYVKRTSESMWKAIQGILKKRGKNA